MAAKRYNGRIASRLRAWVSICLLGSLVVGARGQYLRSPQPGDVFRDYARVMNGAEWRVTDPNATHPNAQTFIPNPILPLTVDDLQDAVRAELIMDFWGGHTGTQDKKFRVNGNAWIPVPNLNVQYPPETVQQVNFVVDIPLNNLVQGVNNFEGTCGGQYFGWGQWGWYQFTLRVYYAASKPHPTGSVTSQVNGGTFVDNPTVTANASGAAGVNRVDFFAYFDGDDPDGDGRYADWQVSYHRALNSSSFTMSDHVGSDTVAPYSVVWDTSDVPDQPAAGVKLVAQVRDNNGYVYVTDLVDNLRLKRTTNSVRLYRSFGLPDTFWVRANQTGTCYFAIPGADPLTNATSAKMLVRSWNGLQELSTTVVNSWVSPSSAYGLDHYYGNDKVALPPSALSNSLNVFKLINTDMVEHGTEILWPGPAFLVKYPAPPRPATVLPAFFNFAPAVGNQVVDLSGNANYGNIVAPAAHAANGRHGDGVQFNGSSGYADLDAISFTGSALTVSMWAYIDDTSPIFARLFAQALSVASRDTFCVLALENRTRLRFRLMTTNGLSDVISSADHSLNAWNHFAITYDGAFMTIYVNGVHHGSLAKTGPTVSAVNAPVWLGDNPGQTRYPLSGKIDEVRIYNFAQNSAQITADMNRAIAGVDVTAPTAPSNLAGTRLSNFQAELTWTGSSDAVGVSFYRVRRNGVIVGASPALQFVDSGLEFGASYSYAVTAVDGAGNESNPSSSATPTEAVPPTVPQNVAAAAFLTTVTLTWTASTDNVGVSNYRVLRNGNEVGTPVATSFVDPGLNPNTSYTYTVIAMDGSSNQSTPSAPATITTPPPDVTPPSIPGGLVATVVTATKIGLNWNTSTDNTAVDHYRVLRNGNQVGTPSGTTFDDSGLTAATEYTYTVIAVDVSNNESDPSAPSVATTDAAPPFTTTGLSLWLRADKGLLTSGSEVSQWTDQSDQERNATQAIQSSRPTVHGLVANGLPVVRFDGVGDFLTFDLPVNGFNGVTVFLVAANTQNLIGSHPANHAPLFWNESAGWGTLFVNPLQSAIKLRLGTGQSGNDVAYARPSSVGSSFSLTTALKSGTTDSIYVNGVLVSSHGGKLTTLAGCRDTGNLGRGYDDNTYFGGDIAEVLVYNRSLSGAELEAVTGYLSLKYNLPIPDGSPLIISQPVSLSVHQPAPATFSVSVVGNATLSYQWRRGGTPIPGATSSSYTLDPTSGADDNGAHFDVVITNAQGAVTSAVATLTVNANWWNSQWRYRVPIHINSGSFARVDKPANATLDFTQMLAPSGGGSMNLVSLRVLEVSDTGSLMNASVPFQFDADATYNASSNARGTLVLLLSGTTPADITRYFHVYFDTAAGFSPASVTPQVSITDDVAHEGQSSFRIVTPTGTYYYHKQGGGFASMEDIGGNDWIGYHPSGGSAGEFRGIPNMGAVAHPGYVNSTSTLISQGPLKATFESDSTDHTWKYRWEIYPGYATMTLLQAGGSYWLLYEGTPGGTFEPGSDFWVRSSGTTTLDNQIFVGDIASPEWVYFGDGSLSRYLFFAHHEDDAASDQYWELENNMTVFGFGRQYPCCERYLTAVPAHLTIGFGESTATAAATINSAYRDLTTTIGGVAEEGQGTVTVTVIGNGSVTKNPDQPAYDFGQTVQLTAVPSPGWGFAGWGGALSGSVSPSDLAVSGDHGVTATFTNSVFTDPPPGTVPGSGLAIWLRADAGTVLNGSGVSQWSDQSGQNRHATQGTGTAQPVLANAAVNGFPAIRFDGADDFLTFNLPVNGLSGMSIILVAARTQNQVGAHPANYSALFWNETTAWGTVSLNPLQSSVNLRFGTTQAGNSIAYNRPASVGSSFTLTSAIKDGATDTLFVNGSQVVSQSDKLTTIAGCQDTANLGRGFDHDTFFAGDIAEVLVYNRALTPAERLSVEHYLDTKYALIPTAAPQIVNQPTDPTVVAPASATFSASADGSLPLSYQWRRNGVAIGGATASTYVLNPTSASDYGAQFDLLVSNAHGMVTSRVATLKVLDNTLGQGLAMWLRAGAGTALSSGSVSQWNDQSGNNRHAGQGTAGSQPLLVGTAANGQPALRFDGVNDYLAFSMPVNGLTAMSIVLVAANQPDQANPASHPAHNSAVFWNETQPWGTVFLSPFQSGVNFRYGTTQLSNSFAYIRPTSVGSSFTVSTGIKDGATDALYVNGIRVDTQTDKLSTIAGCQDTGILGRGFGDNTYYSGDIAEILVYNRALSATERRALEAYLEDTYHLTTPAAPQIFTQSRTNVAVGRQYEYLVSAYGSPPPYYDLVQAPAGIVIDPASGRVSWTPTAADAGDRVVTVRATNSVGTASQTFILRVRNCPPNLLAYWSLDETGGMLFQDFFAVNNAFCVSPTCPTPQAGVVHGGQTFNGVTTQINTPGHPSLNFGNHDSFSLEVWMKTSLAAEIAYLGRIEVMEYSIGQDSLGRPWFYLKDSDAQMIPDLIAPNVAPFNNWHHVVGVRDAGASEARLYVDGVLVNSKSSAGVFTGAFGSATAGINIGWLNLAPGYFFQGNLDEAAIYARALTSAEIYNHYTNGLEGVSICGDQMTDIPQILIQPADVAVTEPASATFTVTAIGTGPFGYEWRRGVANIAGATSSSYTLSPTSLADSGAQFTVVVSNAFGMVTSLVATLTVTSPQPPAIQSAPANRVVVEPASATFSTVATGSAPLAYQWRRGGVDIPGATSSSYTLSPTSQATDNGAQFAVVVSNAVGMVTSAVATLTVTLPAAQAPSIQTHPTHRTVIEPSSAGFAVTATGTAPLAYQWRRGGVNIPGATGSNYTLSPTSQATDNGAQFDVVVSNGLGSVTSVVATLTVNAPVPLPANGLELWLRADRGITLNGATVSQWADQSGNSRHASQGTPSDQPLLRSTALNGLPALRFDGQNDYLLFNLPVNGLTAMTVFLVAANTQDQLGAHPASEAALFWNETQAWGTLYFSPFQSKVSARFGTTQAGNNLSYIRPTSLRTNFSLTTAVKSGSTDTVFVNGLQVLSQGGKLSAILGCQDLGNMGRGFGDNSFFTGDIAEVLVYNRALSIIERRAVESYLDAKYQLIPQEAPNIITQPETTLAAGQPYAYQVIAQGSPAPEFALGQAPSGMTIDSISGQVSWNPSVPQIGNHVVEVLASNSVGVDRQLFVVRVLPCPADLLVYLPLNETSGSVFSDLFAVADAACLAPNCPAPGPGIVGGSQVFDGNASRISTTAIPLLDFANQDSFTFEVWVKTDQAAVSTYLARFSSTLNVSLVQDASGRPWFYLHDNQNNVISDLIAPSTPTFNQWHHVVGVRDANANEARLYVDGVLVNSKNTAGILNGNFASATAELTIGWLNLAPFYYFRGSVDEPAIYRRALNTAEVFSHYTNGLAGNSICGNHANERPQILLQPASLIVTEPAPATFTSLAGGTPPLSYQWRRNGLNIGAATGNTYSLASTDGGTDHGAQFDVVITNASGSVTSVIATLTLHALSLACAGDKSVQCDSAWNFDDPTPANVCGTVSLNILSTVTNLGPCGITFTATRTWRATDSCNNEVTCSQTVTIVDTTAPTIVCVPSKTVECGSAWNFDPPAASDLCGTATLTVVSTVTNAGACGNRLTATRTWKAVDACNNESVTCSQTVTVVDTTVPTITCVANKSVECGSTWNFDPPTTSDLCGTATLTVVSTVTNAGACGNRLTATRTWKAVDACNNESATCSQTVTVADTTVPTITCVANKTVECGSTWNFDPPTSSDLCGTATLTVVSTVTNAGACGNRLTATRTWKAVDACNNESATCSQTVTVVDTTVPTITCVANKTVECGSTWNFDPPTTSDLCGTATLTVVSTVTNTGACGNRFTATRTWKAVDACNNESVTCSQTVTVVDTTVPTLTCVANKSVECGTAWAFDSPTVTDLCGTATLTVVSTVTNTGACGNRLTATRTWKAIDACNNESVTCSQTVTVVDTTVPTITCVANKTVECGSTWNFDPPAASDTCGPVTVSTISTVTNAGTCGNRFTATRTWKAIDPCNNEATCSQTVTVIDTSVPTLTCVANKTVECGSAWIFDPPSASDACGTPTVTVVSTVTNAGPCGNRFTATRTWKATDACSNEATCSQTVTVIDTTVPTITCVANKSVECTSAWDFDSPTASDACGTATVTVISTVTNAGPCGNRFTATRAWKATDACNNEATCSQTVTVVDTSVPTITCVGNKSVECSSAWDFDPPTATDTCGTATVTVVGTVTNAGPCGGRFTATRTWKATDACSNEVTCSQTVTIVDTTVPTITCVANKTVECSSAWDFDPPTATDTCGTAIVTVVGTVTNAGPCGGRFTATRTWKATDACNNEVTCSQTVTIVDTTVPTITCVANKTVACGSAWDFDPPTANDVCGTVTLSEVSTVTNATDACTLQATRTWRATDACNNQTDCSQTVSVVTAPTLTLQSIGPSLRISWIATPGEYLLETKADFSVDLWEPVPKTPEVISGQNVVTITADTAQTTRFYRLRHR